MIGNATTEPTTVDDDPVAAALRQRLANLPTPPADTAPADDTATPTAGPAATTTQPRAKRRPPLRCLYIGHQSAPVAAMGVVFAASLYAHTDPGLSALLLGLAVVVWLALTRSVRTRGGHNRLRIPLAHGSWFLLSAVAGTGLYQTVALVTATYVLAAPGWYRRRIPVPAPAAPAEPPAVEPAPVRTALPPWVPQVPADPIVALWDSNIAARGQFAGARLHSREVLPLGNTRYCVDLVSGSQSFDQLHYALAHVVASGLHMAAGELSLEHREPRREDHAYLVLNVADSGDVMSRKHPDPGLAETWDLATGRLAIGIHPDGLRAFWQLFLHGLMCGLVLGDSGSGKSAFLSWLATAAAETGLISVWAGDPTGGAGMPEVLASCAYPARSWEQILTQLRLAVLAIDNRNDLGGLLDERHEISATEGGILLIIDECHKLVDPTVPYEAREEIARHLLTIAKEGRKANVAVVLADQSADSPLLTNMALLKELWKTNCLVFRLIDPLGGDWIANLKGDPTTLPEVAGTALLAGRRVSMLRTWSVEEDELRARGFAAPMAAIEPMLTNAFGDLWLHRFDVDKDTKAARAERLARLDPSVLQRVVARDPSLADVLDRRRQERENAVPEPTAPEPTATAPTVPAEQSDLAMPDDPFNTDFDAVPAWPWDEHGNPLADGDRLAPPAVEPSAAELAILATLTPGARDLYHLIRSGVSTSGELKALTGIGKTHFSTQTLVLRDHGLIHSPKTGTWLPGRAPATEEVHA